MKNAVATLLLLASCVSAQEFDEKNANGGVLQPCSISGMALTGGSREGYCVDSYGRSGSHICMNIDNSNDDINNFCNLEYSEAKLPACRENGVFPCQEDITQMCPVQNYCVHQCHFSHYLEEIGSCDDIQYIVCDAVNIRSLIAYGKRSYKGKYNNALECIAKKCNIEESMVTQLKQSKCGTTAASLYSMVRGKGNNDDVEEEVNKQIAIWCLAFLALAGITCKVYKRCAKKNNKSKMVENLEKEEAGKDDDDNDTDTVTASVSVAQGN